MKNRKIKSLLSLLFLFVVLVGTLVGCKTASVLPPTIIEKTNTITKKEVIHDTVFETKKDSSYYKAWLECQDGKVVIKGKSQKAKGKYLEPPRVIIKDNYIKVDCYSESQKLFAKWKDTYIKEHNQTTITITNTVEVERKLTWWQKLQIWAGGIFLTLLLLIIIASVLRLKNII
jgi:hypothetical protein